MHASTLSTPSLTTTQLPKARKATRLLKHAVELLEPCGASLALDHSRLALTAAEEMVQIAAATRPKKPPARHRVAREMPRSRAALIRADGTLRHVSYMRESGRRPKVVSVSFRLPGLPALTTSFTLVGREFAPVYAAAVNALAKHVGVDGDAALMQDLIATSEAFRKRYNLL